MRKLQSDKPFYADELYKRYLSATAVLSGDEREWVEQHGKIRIGWLNPDPGISVVNSKSGELVGVLDDYVKTAAVTAKNYFDENAENTVAIEKGKLSLKWYISYNYPKWKIVEYDSAEDVVKAVRSGEADCFVDEIGRLAKYIEDKKLYVASLMQQCNISFAVDLENTVLLSVLNKTLDTMSAAMFSGALSMYENSSQKVTLTQFIKDNLLIVVTVFIVIFGIILVIILSSLKKSRVAEAKAKKAAKQS